MELKNDFGGNAQRSVNDLSKKVGADQQKQLEKDVANELQRKAERDV